jgi:Tol biopolymer transport system component
LSVFLCNIAMVGTEPAAHASFPGVPGKLVVADTRDDPHTGCGLGFACAQIYSMDANGRHPLRLTNDTGDDEYPRWSADGKRIVFVHADKRRTDCPKGLPACIYRVEAMNADGSGRVALTGGGLASDRGPVWSPDGTKIAFASDRADPELKACTKKLSCHFDIYVMNADGSVCLRVTTDGRSTWPSWSPDGTKIAFRRDKNIWVMDPSGSHAVQLTHVSGKVRDGGPNWSPDGTMIAFHQVDLREFLFSLWTMHADGSNQVRITEPGFGAQPGDFDPAWKPNGAKIVDTHYNEFGELGLEIMNPDGSKLRVIPNTTTTFEPDWQPLTDA